MTSFEAPTLSAPAPRARRILAHPYALALRRLLNGMAAGRLTITLPDGAMLEAAGAASGPDAAIHIRKWRALRRLLFNGDIGFSDGFIAGEWSSPDLVALIRLAAANSAALDGLVAGGPAHRLVNRMIHWRRANSRSGSRRNIMSHYDLGNDFFRLWLDPTMLYSSALWDQSTPDLEQAQRAKLARAAALLDLRGAERVLEIGCGWGALAIHLAQQGARSVVGLTLSPAQLELARERVAFAGLDRRVSLRLEDYRDVEGGFDRVVSIEMIEAVGEAYWPAYFGKIAQVLKPDGKALIQAITIDETRFDDYRARPDFIQRHIFPGGFLPTKSAIRDQAERAGLRLAHVETFGQSYARTLDEWRRRFDARGDEVAALGFDEKFMRLWTYYFCYCEAAFREQATDVGFFLLEKSGATS
jgi:cyclopropane-fatty-acyl-phospholipid synthase